MFRERERDEIYIATMSKVVINNCLMKGHAYEAMLNVGDIFDCQLEPSNMFDRNAFAVVDVSGHIIGHIPVNLCHSLRTIHSYPPGKCIFLW